MTYALLFILVVWNAGKPVEIVRTPIQDGLTWRACNALADEYRRMLPYAEKMTGPILVTMDFGC